MYIVHPYSLPCSCLLNYIHTLYPIKWNNNIKRNIYPRLLHHTIRSPIWQIDLSDSLASSSKESAINRQSHMRNDNFQHLHPIEDNFPSRLKYAILQNPSRMELMHHLDEYGYMQSFDGIFRKLWFFRNCNFNPRFQILINYSFFLMKLILFFFWSIEKLEKHNF